MSFEALPLRQGMWVQKQDSQCAKVEAGLGAVFMYVALMIQALIQVDTYLYE
jgi:hypothetical protein